MIARKSIVTLTASLLLVLPAMAQTTKDAEKNGHHYSGGPNTVVPHHMGKKKTDKESTTRLRQEVHICSIVIHPCPSSVRWPDPLANDPCLLWVCYTTQNTRRDVLIKPQSAILMSIPASNSRWRRRAYLESNDLSNPSSQIYVVADGCKRMSVTGHLKRA